MWRIRNVLRFFTIFFFWQAAFLNKENIFGYSSQEMATYNLLGVLMWSFIFATKVYEVGPAIASGEMANMLLKPISQLKYWAAREIGDKLNNIFFSLFEFSFLIIIFKPTFLVPKNFLQLSFFLLLIIMAIILNYFLNYLVALATFWYREGNGWPIRFLYDMLMTVLAGILLPLDMFPQFIKRILDYLPSTYIYYMPLQVWLGKVELVNYFQVFSITFFWICLTFLLIKIAWNRGIRMYESEGR